MGGGSRSAPCSRCFLSALIFFSCGSREQPVSQITKASDRHCWGMRSTVYAPRLLPTIILHPGTATEMLRAGSILQTLAHLQDAVRGVGGRSRMLNPPILPRQTQKCPPMGREGPAACCQVAEGKGRNANGIQVLANGFAVSRECGPDTRVQRVVDGGAGRPLWVLKDHREHRATFGQAEAQPSEGVHEAGRTLAHPCPRARTPEQRMNSSGAGTSPCSSCTPCLQHIPGTELPQGTPGTGSPCPARSRGAGMLAQLWRLLAVPEAGCLPGDGSGRLNPGAHCAPEGAGLGEGTSSGHNVGPRPPWSSRARPAGPETCHSCRISTGLDIVPTAAELGWGQGGMGLAGGGNGVRWCQGRTWSG